MTVKDDLAPLDPAHVADVLSRPPFVSIAGVINVRDLGSYPSVTHPGHTTRPGFLFRSAELSRITKEGPSLSHVSQLVVGHIACVGEAQLKALGITKVFDLRSDFEIQKYNSHQPVIDGVEISRTPVFQNEDYSPEMMAKYVRVTPARLD